jgi:hypothetical protein
MLLKEELKSLSQMLMTVIQVPVTGAMTLMNVKRVIKFMREGCGCHRECHRKLRTEHVVDHILHTYELIKDEKDTGIISALKSSTGADMKKGTKHKQTKNIILLKGNQCA